MPDPTTFESRLTKALESYADQVPDEVDAVAFVHATRGGGRGKRRSLSAVFGGLTRVTAFSTTAAVMGLAAIVAVGTLGLVQVTTTPGPGLPPTSCDGALESGFIATIAGTGQPGSSGDGGPAIEAAISPSVGIAVDSDGNVYFSEVGWIRRVGTDGTITTVASAATGADLVGPRGLAFDRDGVLHVADIGASRIWKVEDDGSTTPVAGTGASGSSGNGGLALEANIKPILLAIGPQGDLYFDDLHNSLRRVDSDGVIHAFAGNSQPGFGGDGGPATEASLSWYVEGIATDEAGSVYLGDSANKRIRKVDPAGTITTIAGTGEFGPKGDGGPALHAGVADSIVGIALDADGSLYFSEYSRNGVRKIDPSGIVTTVAGGAGPGELGDCGPATEALVLRPQGIAVHDGVLYIVEFNRIRMVVL